jgi:hypothetical protein
MASRNYGNAYNTEYNRDLLEDLHANDMYRDTNGQPTYMEPQRLFRGARDYTDRFSRSVGGAMCGDIGRYGGNFVNDRGEVVNEILNHPHIYRGATDAGQPLRRPPGMISPHHKMAFQKILPGSMAYLPQYNAEELYDVNQEEYQVNVFEEIMDDNNGRGYSGGNVGEIYRDEGGNFVAPTQSMMGAGKMGDAYRQFADSDLGQSVIPIAKMGAKSGLKKLASTLIHNPIYRSAANKIIEDQIGSGMNIPLNRMVREYKQAIKKQGEDRKLKRGGGSLANIAKELQILKNGDNVGKTIADELIAMLKPHINKLGTALLPEGKKLYKNAKKEIDKILGSGWGAVEGYNPDNTPMTDEQREAHYQRTGIDIRRKKPNKLFKPSPEDFAAAFGKKIDPMASQIRPAIPRPAIPRPAIPIAAAIARLPPQKMLGDKYAALGSGLDLTPKKRGRPKKVPLPPSVQKVLDGEPSKTIQVVGGAVKRGRGRPRKDGGMFSGLKDRLKERVFGGPSSSVDKGDLPYEDDASKERRGVKDKSGDDDDFGIDLADEEIFKEIAAAKKADKLRILLKMKRLFQIGIGNARDRKLRQMLEARLIAEGKLLPIGDWIDSELEKLEKSNSPSMSSRPQMSKADATKYGLGTPRKRGRPKKGGNLEMTIENMVQKVAPTNSADKRKSRAALIKKIMSEMKLKLGEASKYIKENNLI